MKNRNGLHRHRQHEAALRLAGVLAILVLTACQTTGAWVDVGGFQLYINCTGEGSPTVVMDAGLDGSGLSWLSVQPGVTEFTRACSYDRAGIGLSGWRPKPSTSQQLVGELHTLLTNAKVEGPYVLVGHSLGGLNVRLYTNQYPNEVVGLVLIDSPHPDWPSRVRAILPPEVVDTFDHYLQENKEGVDLLQSFEQSSAIGPLGALPLIILEHGKSRSDLSSTKMAQQLDQIWEELQADLAALSSNSSHIVAVQSGHGIHREQPELVIDAIWQVVVAAQRQEDQRTHSTLSFPEGRKGQ